MRFTSSVSISCKPKDLFTWVANPDKARKWQKNVKGGEIIKKTKNMIGTTFKEVVEENGKSLEMRGEITKYEQDRLIAFHLVSKIHQVDVKYTVEEMGIKSKVNVIADIHWKFPMNVMGLFIGRKIKEGIQRQTKSELEELKRLCEA